MKITIKKQPLLHLMLYYWIIIIAWQWIRPVGNRSLLDTLVKMGVFLMVMLYAYRHARVSISRFFGLALFLYISTQIVTVFYGTGTVTTGTLITIAFMWIQIFAFLVFLGSEEITEEHLLYFCYGIFVIALIMAIFNIFLYWDRFRGLFRAGGAYGSECKSFLYSNHEFGIYLSAGILSGAWLATKKRIKKFVYILSFLFLFVNLLSSYSRTAIIGCVAAIYILAFFYRKKLFWQLLAVGAVVLFVCYSVPSAYEIVFEKIMKGTFTEGQVFDEGRASTNEAMWYIFKSGGWFTRLFGRGYAGWSGGHNAYLAILLLGGIFMFAFFIAVITWSIYHAIQCTRKDTSVGSLLLAYIVFSCLYMVAQTPILFFSPMDNYFITMITVLVPKYVYNYYCKPDGGADLAHTAN